MPSLAPNLRVAYLAQMKIAGFITYAEYWHRVKLGWFLSDTGQGG